MFGVNTVQYFKEFENIVTLCLIQDDKKMCENITTFCET